MFWLRPETAMWRELDIRAMQQFEFLSPSLDLGCGDGVFSFIRSGGMFDQSYDAFRSVSNLEQFFENVDVFDSFDNTKKPIVVQKPAYEIDLGFDHKENLLKKADQLNFYRSLRQGDANKQLPFKDNSFNSVFSNIVYWLDEPDLVINEIARILSPGGKVCLMLPNDTLPEFSFYNELYLKSKNVKWKFLEKLDRGRFSANIRHARTQQAWEKMFNNSELKINEHVSHLSDTTVKIWDIGLRPLFPVLLKMTNSLDKENLLKIKQEWIETLREFLEPIILMDDELGEGLAPAFHCYILEK